MDPRHYSCTVACASVTGMTEGADGFVAVGYSACRHCGEWKVEGTLRNRLCDVCIKAGVGRLEVVQLGERPAPKRPSRGRRTKPLTAVQRDRKKKWNRARSRALMRLARLNHPLYEVLLAEELAAEGLDPRLDQRAGGSAAFEREMARSDVG